MSVMERLAVDFVLGNGVLKAPKFGGVRGMPRLEIEDAVVLCDAS